MKKLVAIVGFVIILPLSGAAFAQDLPGWGVNASCSAGDDFCVRFEQRARGEVSGVWDTVPPGVRSACISETGAIEKSYRLLQDCLANKMLDLMKGHVNQRS